MRYLLIIIIGAILLIAVISGCAETSETDGFDEEARQTQEEQEILNEYDDSFIPENDEVDIGDMV